MAKVNIYRDKSHEPTVKAINNSKMFENNAHFLTFCAHYGVSINKRKKNYKAYKENQTNKALQKKLSKDNFNTYIEGIYTKDDNK